MNKQLKLSALAVAIGAMMTVPAFANYPDHDPNSAKAKVSNSQEISTSSSETAFSNSTTVKGNYDQNSSGNQGVNVANGLNNAQANQASIQKAAGTRTRTFAMVKNDQDMGSWQGSASVTEDWGTNKTTVSGNAFRGFHGNAGINVANGDQNMQGNSLAIAKGNGTKPGHETDALAMIFSHQTLEGCGTGTVAQGVHNSASLSGNVLRGASGNIGVNVADGAQNMQANSVAISRNSNGSNSYGITKVSQEMMGTQTTNSPDWYNCTKRLPINSVSISGNVMRGVSGNVDMNVASGYDNMQSNTLAISTTAP